MPESTSSGDLVIRRLDADEWELLRRLRFEALQESPAAFGSTYEREVAFDEALWRSRLETSVWFVAESEAEVIGMACALRLAEPDREGPPVMELLSMWVAPLSRRCGVGARLVESVLSYAQSEGEPLVGLWVAAGNASAVAFYSALGFERTGEGQEMPNRPESCEIRMTRQL